MREESAHNLFQSLRQEAFASVSGLGREVFFDPIHPAFPPTTMALPTLQAALKAGLGEAVMECDMTEPCKFPSLLEEVPVDPQGS